MTRKSLTSARTVLACGCLHGIYRDEVAVASLLKLRDDLKPDVCLFLGDGLDTSSFRAGASGNREEGVSSDADAAAFSAFIRELRPRALYMGNHEARVYRLRSHPRDIVATAARWVVDSIEALAREVGAVVVPYTGALDAQGWRSIGGVAFGHGVVFGENAPRDHAEALGCDVIHAHTHRLASQPARTLARLRGVSVGCLAAIPALEYAAGRRATMAWEAGCAVIRYGEGQRCHEIELRTLAATRRETVCPLA